MVTTTADKLAELREKLDKAREPGSPRAIERRRSAGRPSARQRIESLLDPGSFQEIGALAKSPGNADNPFGDGVVTGHGTVEGRPVAVFSHDQTVFGGSIGEAFGRKVVATMEHAAKVGCPMIGINDSGGARVQDAVTSLAWYAEMGPRHAQLVGVVPQISIMLGNCAGGAVYSPINTDVVVATAESHMFVTGPEVIRSVTGEDITLEELGGAYQQLKNGNVHHVAKDEAEAFAWVREYLSYMPSNAFEQPPVVNPGLEPEVTDSDLELDAIIPDSDNSGYDMHDVIVRIFDDGAFHEMAAQTANNVITGFARIDGRPVGVVANQPMFLSGALDAEAADKATRFVRLCDVYSIPLVFLVDTPGFLPGAEQERIGVIRRGGRFLFSFVEATVPKVTVVIRKAYGGGYAVMGCKQLGADLNFAWPTARIAVMGAEGAVTLLRKREIEAAGEKGEELKAQLIKMYNEFIATPYVAAERGYIDGVIEPSSTRLELRKAFRLLRDKHVVEPQRKHKLMPV
ncbi:acyl-CoA carboxylase subunit beta [Tomitella gaofuii]|uniref:acyl-CoA carboxylase subunit beta n=1 Tax=Tomitella gaofuii TaxID=2760083 RepID=UPI0015F7ADAF|nr:acyl-CoA carboxylase subunit beta [Tomitella gaofuii]